MKIFIANTYDGMSKQAADAVLEIMGTREYPVICAASGDSPAGLYNQIVDRVKSNHLDISKWRFLGLDEWVGMNGNDEGSCRYHLNNQLFSPLQIAEKNICFFDGRANDLEAECKKVEDFIVHQNGIDVAILGLGTNGHVGMNEPGSSVSTTSRVTDLAETTKKVGQKYFKEKHELTKGITLGIATLMKARHIVLIVSGKHKAEITKQIIEDEISEQLPATLLRRHPSFRIFLDKEAAGKIIQF